MKIKDLKFRELDRHYYFIEDLNLVKRIYKKLHIKGETNPVLVYGYINHDTGIQFRILGNIIVNDGVLSIEDSFIKKEFTIEYDDFEEMDVKPVPKETIVKINGTMEIEDDIQKYYTNKSLIKSRDNIKLDQYRDLRLVDDVQFLLLTKEAQQENVWARIEAEEDNGILSCILLDKTKKQFNLKKNDKIHIKYVEHPKYKGLMFVKKI